MIQEKIVKIIEVSEEVTLSEFTIEELDLAFSKAREYEEMGIDVKVIAPSAPETLAMALGSSKKDLDKLKKTIEHEISEHDLEACIGCVSSQTK